MPGKSSTRVSAGILISSAGPALSILSPRMSTAQPARGSRLTPSKTRAGFKSTDFTAVWPDKQCAARKMTRAARGKRNMVVLQFPSAAVVIRSAERALLAITEQAQHLKRDGLRKLPAGMPAFGLELAMLDLDARPGGCGRRNGRAQTEDGPQWHRLSHRQTDATQRAINNPTLDRCCRAKAVGDENFYGASQGTRRLPALLWRRGRFFGAVRWLLRRRCLGLRALAASPAPGKQTQDRQDKGGQPGRGNHPHVCRPMPGGVQDRAEHGYPRTGEEPLPRP